MQPWAAVTPDGVEVHLPGDAESEAFRVGLIQALMMRKRAGDFLLGNAALEARCGLSHYPTAHLSRSLVTPPS
jgi:hypothetical protein